MSDGVEFFSRVLQKSDDQCPDGMSVFEWKRLKEAQAAERHLTRNESVVIRTKEDLAALLDRGEVFSASDLALKRQSEEEAQREFEIAAEDMQRDRRFQSPRPTTKDTTLKWTREKIDE